MVGAPHKQKLGAGRLAAKPAVELVRAAQRRARPPAAPVPTDQGHRMRVSGVLLLLVALLCTLLAGANDVNEKAYLLKRQKTLKEKLEAAKLQEDFSAAAKLKEEILANEEKLAQLKAKGKLKIPSAHKSAQKACVAAEAKAEKFKKEREHFFSFCYSHIGQDHNNRIWSRRSILGCAKASRIRHRSVLRPPFSTNIQFIQGSCADFQNWTKTCC